MSVKDIHDMEWEGRPSDEELYGVPDPKASCNECKGTGTVTYSYPSSYADKSELEEVDEPCPKCKGGTVA